MKKLLMMIILLVMIPMTVSASYEMVIETYDNNNVVLTETKWKDNGKELKLGEIIENNPTITSHKGASKVSFIVTIKDGNGNDIIDSKTLSLIKSLMAYEIEDGKTYTKEEVKGLKHYNEKLELIEENNKLVFKYNELLRETEEITLFNYIVIPNDLTAEEISLLNEFQIVIEPEIESIENEEGEIIEVTPEEKEEEKIENKEETTNNPSTGVTLKIVLIAVLILVAGLALYYIYKREKKKASLMILILTILMSPKIQNTKAYIREELINEFSMLSNREIEENSGSSIEPEEPIDYNVTVNLSDIVNGEREDINYTEKIEELGNPALTTYPNGGSHAEARNVWDMQLYNNRIYIGSGNMNANTGPVEVYYYDIEKEEFVTEGVLDEENIGRFVIIDDKLMVPGRDGHSHGGGSIYVWDDNSWVENRIVSKALHVWEIAKFKDKIFAGFGGGATNIAVSEDGGQTYSNIDLYHFYISDYGNINRGDAHRVYDMFELNGNLYAHTQEDSLFKYIEKYNIFLNVGTLDLDEGVLGVYQSSASKVKYKDRIVFCLGSIIHSGDVEDIRDIIKVKFDKEFISYDTLVINDELYVLGIIPGENNLYYATVIKTNDYLNWEPVLYFENYNSLPISFEYNNGVFYFGLAYNKNISQSQYDSGKILKVTLE